MRCVSAFLLVSAASSGAAAAQPAAELLARQPIAFEANVGQTASDVRFTARGPRHMLLLRAEGPVLALRDRDGWARLDVTLNGGEPQPVMRGVGELAGPARYYRGSGVKALVAPRFRRVEYVDVYPGIDLVFYGDGRRLEHDFVVGPGASPDAIELEIGPARSVVVDAAGDLVVTTRAGVVRLERPRAFQVTGSASRSVEADFRVAAGAGDSWRVRFGVGAYDPGLPLIVDPVIDYSTYVGGGVDDEALDLAVDGAGNAYVVGWTRSTDFPTVAAVDSTLENPLTTDAFVLRLASDGASLDYSTYFGGTEDDNFGFGDIAVDTTGNAWIVGGAGNGIPTTGGAFQASPQGGQDCFVVKLDPAGALVWATYVGGPNTDHCEGVAVDASGAAYLTGQVGSAAFPVTPGAFDATLGSNADGFVAKLLPDGSDLAYASFLGGGGSNDTGREIAVDASGSAYVTGSTISSDFPTAGALQGARNGVRDAYVTKVSGDGTSLIYSTYLGGAGLDFGFAIDVDSSGAAYVAGRTDSSDFPVTAGVVGGTSGGGDDGFVVKLAPDGASLVFATYLGGAGDDKVEGLVIDSLGRAHVAGQTGSSDFPLLDPIQAAITPGTSGVDAFVTVLAPDAESLSFSTFLGGRDSEAGRDSIGIDVDSQGRVYLAGPTSSDNFPTTSGAFQAVDPDGPDVDAFVVRIDLSSTGDAGADAGVSDAATDAGAADAPDAVADAAAGAGGAAGAAGAGGGGGAAGAAGGLAEAGPGGEGGQAGQSPDAGVPASGKGSDDGCDCRSIGRSGGTPPVLHALLAAWILGARLRRSRRGRTVTRLRAGPVPDTSRPAPRFRV